MSEISKVVGIAMKFRNFKYYIEEAFISVARNRLMSLSSIATVGACIFIVIFSICVAANLDFMLSKLERTVMTVTIDNSVEDVSPLWSAVENLEHVQSTEYISREQALEEFAATFGDGENGDQIRMLSADNPMRRYIRVEPDDPRNAEDIITQIQAMEGIVEVKHAHEITNMLISLNNAVRIVSIVMILILTLLSVIIIMNTIKLTVNNRRTEITIMKYVGATEWFIRCPFMIEGIIIGLAGALIPIAASWLLYDSAIAAMQRNFAMLANVNTFKQSIELFPMLIPIALLLGALIGILGSVTSMRKHLSA